MFLWSDSKTALNYLRSAKTNIGSYIMRKWNKIRVNTKVDNWRYIPAEMNNSGILSYVVLFDKFRLLSTCLTGPEFLAPNN